MHLSFSQRRFEATAFILTKSLFIAALIASQAYGQPVNFSDNFSDGNFIQNPMWSGTDSLFRIIEVSGNSLLQLNADGHPGGEAYLSSPSSRTEGSWEFYINMDFAPSGSNYALIYLISDRPDLDGSVNGYAVRGGQRGSDDRLRLIRLDHGTVADTLITGQLAIGEGGGYRVKISRTLQGRWTLQEASGYHAPLSSERTPVTDLTHAAATHFGVRTIFTRTRSEKFLFDFSITFNALSARQLSKSELEVVFSAALKPSSVDPQDFRLTEAGSPSKVIIQSDSVVRLRYKNSLPSGGYELAISDMEGRTGQQFDGPSVLELNIFDAGAPGDIVINELLPAPPAGLPEYVELKNRSTKTIDLMGWRVCDANRKPVLVSEDKSPLRPGEFVVLVPELSEHPLFEGARQLEVAGMPILNNQDDQIVLYDSKGIKMDSLAYSRGWLADEKAIERLSGEVGGHYKANWKPSKANQAGTPGFVNTQKPDLVPPRIREITATDASTLRITFDDRLHPGWACTPSELRITPSVEVAGIDYGPSSLHLKLASRLQHTTAYRLQIQSGVPDLFGNTSREELYGDFVYYDVDAAGTGDVLINEFLYNPADDLSEYVELYNPTDRAFDLSGWTLNDATGRLRELTYENQRPLLKPESFLVLAADSSILKLNVDASLQVMGSRFPALNQGGDAIVLRDSAGAKLDSLYYSSQWGDGTQALERQHTHLSAVYPQNWATGFGSQVGTPGLPNNKLPPDTVGPELRHINLVDSATIRMVFSEALSEENAAELNNYTITPDRAIKHVLLRGDTLDLELEEPLLPQTAYRIAVASVEDLFQNQTLNIERPVTYYRYDSTQPGDIVINEFLYKGEPEFVELYNRSGKTVNLKNWTLADRNSYNALFKTKKAARPARSIQSGIPMLPDSYIALTGNKALASTQPNIHYIDGLPALNNSRESISIHDQLNNTIDSLSYDSQRWNTGSGESLERKDPGAGSADPANWGPSPEGYSPGRPNLNYERDRVPPEIKMARVASDTTIEVLFSEFVAPEAELWSFSLEGQELSVSGFTKETADRIKLDFSGGSAPSRDLRLTAEGLSDLRGNTAPRLSIPVAWPVEAGDVVINELLTDPLSDNRDGLADQAEYVELYNRKRYAVSLEGIYLHDDPDENNRSRDLQPVSTRARWLRAEGYALVHASTARDPLEQPVLDYFNIPGLSTNRNIVINRSSLRLNNDNGAIYLADSTGATLDSLYYRGTWHNPNLIDTKGLSLERINPGLPSNDPQNWSTSTHRLGGTPAAANSILLKPATPAKKSAIGFSPNPFSPDADGHEDHLAISYRLDAPDYLLRIRIFDRHGRLVRKLADAKQAGFEGQILWEGRNEEGQELRIGIYIVLFEAYNSSSGKNRTFKKTVVLARKL